MNSCPEKEILILYHLGMLDCDKKMMVEEHLKECLVCQKAVNIEMEIEKELSSEMDPDFIEEKIMRKIQIYKSLPKYYFWLKPLRVFLVSTTIFCLLFALYYFLIGFTSNFFPSNGREEAKGLSIIFNLLLNEFSSLLKTEESQMFITLTSGLFFIFNFLYGFKKYFFRDKFI